MTTPEDSKGKLENGETNNFNKCTALSKWRKEQQGRHLKLELARKSRSSRKNSDSIPIPHPTSPENGEVSAVIQSKMKNTLSPKKQMASKRKARLSDDGARILNKISKESDNPPLLSKRKITQACKQLESVINYEVYGNFSFRMQNVHSFLEERMRRANIEDKNLVWYLDKGRGRVVSTVGLVGSSTTQSHYNKTILQKWKGSDHYDALAYHDVGKFYKELSMDNYKIYVEGDYSFLATINGLSCGMAYPCTWCSKKFIKKSNSEESIDLEVYESRSDKRVEEAIAKDKKLKKRKEKIIEIPEEMIVPPILHSKIKIGNLLFNKLCEAADDQERFNVVLKQCQLDVDRHEEKIIYTRFHGNDIKRMCTSIDALSKVSTSEGYQQIIKAMDVFNEWSKIVSSTKKNISDKELMVLYCRNGEHLGEQCCQTIKLARCLDVVGGASKSALVHIVLMHLGPFAWKHKMIGALAEEGIEAVHCRFAEEMKRHGYNKVGKVQNSLKWKAIDTLMFDKGYI
ncbi:unnamed protein product [Bursaphelenchus okinawaensis]|uniref:Uncharacterized protein n=1 Tax=Bursaphelenchus okinawaensis TaxID=465554 RepID=A0A811K1Z2_9BILA|nr:unnamed protein product [Bursaphelenchus okinawaensis]CAG9089339.1 unnamed protein product [Bursaphelenchus okinawaensis]